MSARQDRYVTAMLLLALFLGIAVNAAKKLERRPAVKIGRSGAPESDSYSTDAEPAMTRKRININTAPLEDLMKLKGVGRIRAQRIIDYRSSRGPFRAPEELRNVKGISQKILLDNRDRLTVGETE
jgi:competence protein ComEA